MSLTPYETILLGILDDVKRPDLGPVAAVSAIGYLGGGSGEIDRRIQRALTTYHRKDTWKADFVEQEYVFAVEQTAVPTVVVSGGNSLFMNQFGSVANGIFIQQININYLTRYRQTLYIRKWQLTNAVGTAILDPATGLPGTAASGDFVERSPDRMFDGYGGDLNDIMYRSGDMINLRSSTPMNKVFIGYFADPLIQPVEHISSWIAKKYSAVIIADVAARIFKVIGKDEEAKSARETLMAETLLLESNNVRLALA